MANPCLVRAELNRALPAPASIIANSPDDLLYRLDGQLLTKDITCSGGAGAKLYNLFSMGGAATEMHIEIRALYGIFTDVSNVVTASTCYWDVYDNVGPTVALTAAAGVNCSGARRGSMILKNAVAANAATFIDNVIPVIAEMAGSDRQFQGCVLLNGIAGGTNYLRFGITQDANTNCQIRFYVLWTKRSANSVLVAV